MTVDAQIASSLEIAAATNAGSPVIVSDPEHQLSVAVRQLASDLAGEMVGALGGRTPHPAERGGGQEPPLEEAK